MGRQRRVYRPVRDSFPEDFPERLVRFKERAGLSWRSLARQMGVQPKLLRAWRSGVVPGSTHLFNLLALADGMGLMDLLVRAHSDAYDLEEGFGVEGDAGEGLRLQ